MDAQHLLYATDLRDAEWAFLSRCCPTHPESVRLSRAAGKANHGSETAIHVHVGRAPRGDADAHGGPPLPDGGAAPAGPVVLDGGDHSARALWLAERDKDLVQHDLVEDRVAS